jgi:hypothetical protein
LGHLCFTVTNIALINALAYELGLLLTDRFPGLIFKAWFQRMMAHCRADWAEWRTKRTMRKVDAQSNQIMKQWAEDHRTAQMNKLVKKAKEKFPGAKVTPAPDAFFPSVIIEEDEEGDTPLGGPMRITWNLDD